MSSSLNYFWKYKSERENNNNNNIMEMFYKAYLLSEKQNLY